MLNSGWKIRPTVSSYLWRWMYKTSSCLTENHLIIHSNDRTIRIGRHHQSMDDNVMQLNRGFNNNAPYLYYHPHLPLACQCSRDTGQISFMIFPNVMPNKDRVKWLVNYHQSRSRKFISGVEKK